MTTQQTFIKGKYQLNKQASGDYDNLEAYQWVDVFNSFQVLYTRFLIKQAEKDKTSVSDLNFLLQPKELKVSNQNKFAQTSILPTDFLNWSRLEIEGSKDNCTKTAFKLYATEEANAGVYLENANKKPSFSWGETFYTFVGKRIRIYTGGDFSVKSVKLTYYRKPKNISLEGTEDELGNLMNKTVNPEWNDDVCEILISGTVAKIAGNIEYLNKFQIANQEVQQFT